MTLGGGFAINRSMQQLQRKGPPTVQPNTSSTGLSTATLMFLWHLRPQALDWISWAWTHPLICHMKHWTPDTTKKGREHNPLALLLTKPYELWLNCSQRKISRQIRCRRAPINLTVMWYVTIKAWACFSCWKVKYIQLDLPVSACLCVTYRSPVFRTSSSRLTHSNIGQKQSWMCWCTLQITEPVEK